MDRSSSLNLWNLSLLLVASHGQSLYWWMSLMTTCSRPEVSVAPISDANIGWVAKLMHCVALVKPIGPLGGKSQRFSDRIPKRFYLHHHPMLVQSSPFSLLWRAPTWAPSHWAPPGPHRSSRPGQASPTSVGVLHISSMSVYSLLHCTVDYSYSVNCRCSTCSLM